VDYARQLLQAIGIEPERLQMINISSAMGLQFAEAMREISEKIGALGPNPLGGMKLS
jgi:coenzyme F420-reducing hydrogenase delta subunit